MKLSWKNKCTMALGVVFAVAVFCSSFCQPFISGAVLGAIPAHATFTHKAATLDELWGSPVLGQLDKALGAGNSMEALLRSNDWLPLAAPSEIVIASLPVRYAGQPPAWVAASWVGWRSPWLRWKLEHARIEGLSFFGKHSVWPIWRYETPEIARGSYLTFALTDNLFMTCLSDNPTDILLLLDTYDQRIRSLNPPN
jgi:hypothetical protein